MHENAARALQYYEDLPRRSGRPELRLVETEPRPRRRVEPEPRARRRGGARHRAAADSPSAPAKPRPARADARPARPRRHEAPPRRRQLILPRRRQTVAPRIAGRPDRVAMWAVLLGFFLTGVAAATGHG
jgi:hypothetical protein